MRLLLFGGKGQLGTEIRLRANDLRFEVAAPVGSEVDITNPDQVFFQVRNFKPEVIINCAAYTLVDKAEQEPEAAFKVNADGVRYLAEAAKSVDARLLHVSTDYVFDGLLGRPLREDDPTNPQSVYGKSKLAGEQIVAELLGERSLIVRTSSLHGTRGINFVSTMVKLCKERDELKVVQDQIMSPTWAGWLAEVLLDLVRVPCCGIVHASGAGAVSWYDFTKAIYERIEMSLERKTPLKILPTTAAEFGRPAKRPTYSVFDCSRLTSLLGRPPITWQQGLDAHLIEMGFNLKL